MKDEHVTRQITVAGDGNALGMHHVPKELIDKTDIPDMVDRLMCMATEKNYELSGPYLSDTLKETAKADIVTLRKAAAMLSVLL